MTRENIWNRTWRCKRGNRVIEEENTSDRKRIVESNEYSEPLKPGLLKCCWTGKESLFMPPAGLVPKPWSSPSVFAPRAWLTQVDSRIPHWDSQEPVMTSPTAKFHSAIWGRAGETCHCGVLRSPLLGNHAAKRCGYRTWQPKALLRDTGLVH